MKGELLTLAVVAVAIYFLASEGPVRRRSLDPDELEIPDGPDEGRIDLEALASSIARDAGVRPALFLGIIDRESRWNANATNLSGPDARRGGAWGLTQMTLTTARAFDSSVTGQELLDPVTNLRIAGQLLADNARRSTDDRDTAAMWNSGKLFDYAPESTRYEYVPDVLERARKYEVDRG